MVKFRIRTKIMATVTFLVMSAAVILGGYDMQNAEATGGTDYVKYTFATGQTQTYNLPEIPTVNRTNSLAMRVLLSDDGDPRPDADLDTATVQVRAYTDSEHHSGYYGTGFIIGQHEVMTAAHIANNFDKPVTIVIPDTNPLGTNYMELNVVSAHIPQAFFELVENSASNDEIMNEDYAILTVSEDLSAYGCYSLGMGTDSIMQKNVPVHCLGYKSKTLKKADGLVSDIGDLRYEFDFYSTGGSSGGPIYVESSFGVPGTSNQNYQIKTYRTVVSIDVGHKIEDAQSAIGVRIRPEIMQFAYDNDYL